MSVGLDLKDKKIMYELDVNSRSSNAEIAKKVGLSKQVVGFRIKRLWDEKVLSNFYTIIDISKLGYTAHKNYVRLQNLDAIKEAELIQFLKNHPQIIWLASCDGKFDFIFSIWARNMEELDKTLAEINTKYGSYISERQLATIIRGEYFTRDYLISKSRGGFSKSFFGSVPISAEVDAFDWNILLQLGKNSRLTAVEIAELIKTSPDMVRDRIKKLEKSGVIKHYNIVPNESVYPYLHYKILVGLKNISTEKEKSIIEFCLVNPTIVYVVKALGPWELEIDLEVESPEQYRKLMMNLKTQFSEVIKDYSSLQIYQVHKYNFCPSVSEIT